MKRVIEVSGKTVEAAINEGLSQLGITMDEADIKVLNAGGLFKKAKVEISTGEDAPIATAPSAPKNDKPEKKFEPNKSENKAFEPKRDENHNNNNQQKRFEPKRVENQNNNNQQKKSEPNTVASQNNEERKTFLKKDVAINNNNTKNAGANSGTKQFAKSNNNSSNNNNNNSNFDEKRRPKKPFVEKTSVSAPVTEEHIATVTEFLTKLLGHMHIEGAVEIKEDNGMRIVIDTTDSAIIGYRGEVLDAIQYLTSLKINEKAGKEHILLSVDALGYREKRVETLKNLAQKTAEKCIKNNRRVSLEPMNSADRRIIHAALSENEQVITRSEGHEPTRRIVVLPKR